MKLNSNLSLNQSIILIAPFFLWGSAMVVMKGVITQTTPLFLATMRLFPAGILILLVAVILKLPQPKTPIAWLWIILFALIDAVMFQGFLAEGLSRTDAGLGSVMIDSQPLAVAILSRWLFHEIIGFWGWLGLGIGIIGISFIGLPTDLINNFLQINSFDFSLNLLNLFDNGQWLMLLASLSMAIGTIMIPFISKHVNPVVATGWHMILGGIILFFCSITWENNQWINLNLQGWLSISYATIFGSAIAYGLFFYLASKGNLTSLSALTFLTPLFALSLGNLFLQEILSSLQWIGVGLTLISIYLINQREYILTILNLKKINILLNNTEEIIEKK